MNNTNKSTPAHLSSGPLFQTPILSPDEKTFVRSPYGVPKMRKFSYLMDLDQIIEQNPNEKTSENNNENYIDKFNELQNDIEKYDENYNDKFNEIQSEKFNEIHNEIYNENFNEKYNEMYNESCNEIYNEKFKEKFNENYNYNESNKLFFRHKENFKKENTINMTNKILNQCKKTHTNSEFFEEKSSFLSENEEFCSENQAFLQRDLLNKSKSEEFSIVSMPAKLGNFERLDSSLEEIHTGTSIKNLMKSKDDRRNFDFRKKISKETSNFQKENLKESSNFRKESSFIESSGSFCEEKCGKITEICEKQEKNKLKNPILHELQLKDAIQRQNLGKMRKCIEDLKQELEEIKAKNEILLKDREKVVYFIFYFVKIKILIFLRMLFIL